MLINFNIYNDFKRLLGFIQEIDRQTDGRYRNKIEMLTSVLYDLSKDLDMEIKFADTIYRLKMDGFLVDSYLYKFYDSVDTLKKDLTNLIETCNYLNFLKQKIDSLGTNVPSDLKNRFLTIYRDPLKVEEAKLLYEKIVRYVS